jgi:hypothetical protein
MNINQPYTREQAMERLGIESMSAFRRFERKYPQAVINVNLGVHRDTQPLYDKTALDTFAHTHHNLLKSEGSP